MSENEKNEWKNLTSVSFAEARKLLGNEVKWDEETLGSVAQDILLHKKNEMMARKQKFQLLSRKNKSGLQILAAKAMSS